MLERGERLWSLVPILKKEIDDDVPMEPVER
jgi:hypothetical protein